MIKPGNAGLGATKPDEPLPGDDEFDVYRKRMMLAYKYRPNPMVCPLSNHSGIGAIVGIFAHLRFDFQSNQNIQPAIYNVFRHGTRV